MSTTAARSSSRSREELHGVGFKERRHSPCHLPGNSQWLPARGEDLRAQGRRKHAGHDLGGGFHDVLAIVEDQQRLAGFEAMADRAGPSSTRPWLLDAEGQRHAVPDELAA